MEAVIDQAGEQTNPVVQNRNTGVSNSEKEVNPSSQGLTESSGSSELAMAKSEPALSTAIHATTNR